MKEDKKAEPLQEIYDLIPWNMTPGCNEARKRLGLLIIAEQSRNKEMIPVSVIDARIKELEPLADMTEQIPAECLNDPTVYNIVVQTRIDELKRLKKQAQ